MLKYHPHEDAGKAIWKYEVSGTVEMPRGAMVISIASQGVMPVAWALVDPKETEKTSRRFRVFMTGQLVLGDEPMVYLGTTTNSVGLVLHIFEVVED